jgi:flagellar protein FliS
LNTPPEQGIDVFQEEMLMVTANPYQQYQEAQIETASQGRLILMLYDGALRFITQAHQAMVEKRFQESHKSILRAEEIVTELMACLKLDAGDIAKNLFRLYEYYNWRLIQANIKRDPGMLLEVQGHLRSLREAWVEAARISGMQTTPQTGVA